MPARNRKARAGKFDIGFVPFQKVGEHVRLDVVDPKKRFFQGFREGLGNRLPY